MPNKSYWQLVNACISQMEDNEFIKRVVSKPFYLADISNRGCVVSNGDERVFISREDLEKYW